MWILYILFLIIFELIADIFAKEWALHGHLSRWVFAIGAYILGNIFWLFALSEGSGLARGAIIFSVASAILAILVGLLFYREEIIKLQFSGLILGVFSIILIFWE